MIANQVYNTPYPVPMNIGNMMSLQPGLQMIPVFVPPTLCPAPQYVPDVLQYMNPNALCQSVQAQPLLQPFPSPVQQQPLCPSPLQQFALCPPSPPPVLFVQQPVQQPTQQQIFHFTPSPSPEFFPLLTSVENCGPSSLSHSAETIPSLLKIFAFEINQAKASIEEVKERYENGLEEAFRTVLQYPNLDLTVRFINSQKKIITIEWFINRDQCNEAYIKQQTQRGDFEALLICEMTKIDGGSFGTYLNRGKQLTIVREGWAVLEGLQGSLISRGLKANLLALPQEQRFDEDVVEGLYKVSQDEQGNALRGSTVCCARFKLLQDIWKMRSFIDAVQQRFPVLRSTMIASLKKHKQYKGWSLYLDVGTEANVESVIQLAEQCNFKKTKVFAAVENK